MRLCRVWCLKVKLVAYQIIENTVLDIKGKLGMSTTIAGTRMRRKACTVLKCIYKIRRLVYSR